MRLATRPIAVLLALCLMMLAGPALAQDLYPLSGAITCDRSVVSPGASVICAANGFDPDSSVDVDATGATTDRAGSLSGRAASTWSFSTTVTADGSGLATATIQVPSDAVGPVTVSFTGIAPDLTPRTLRAIGAFTVVAAPTPSEGDDGAAPGGSDAPVDGSTGESAAGGGVLSSTGAPLLLGGAAVLVLLAIGAVLVNVGRRHRRVRV